MSITTRTITATIFDNDGDPLENARVEITLRGLGNEPGGAVSPGTQVQLTNASGVATFELWQNNGSYSNTFYEISSWNPVTGKQIHRRERFLVPSNNADVKELLALGLAGVDPTLSLLQQVQSALSGTVAAANSVAGAVSTVTDMAEEAVSALNQVNVLKGQTEGFANSASSSASAASNQSGIATGAATTATNQAGIATSAATTATEQAVISTTKASESASNAAATEANKNSSSSSASTASTQAGIATAAATTATDKADIATIKAGEANASKIAAQSSEALAQKWASEVEDTPVTGSLYSAFHWAKKAEGFAAVASAGGVTSVNGKTGSSITLVPADIGAATSAQGAKADSAIQPSDLSAALSGYVESSSLSTTLSNYVMVSGFATALNDYYTKTAADARYLQNGAIEASSYVKRIRTLALAAL